MHYKVKAGSTGETIPVFPQHSGESDGRGLAGLVWNTSGLTCKYKRQGAAASVSVTLADMTLGTWASGGFKEIDASGMRGSYEFGMPDTAIAVGARWVEFEFSGATSLADTPVMVYLTATDDQDATRGGMTALPAAAAGATDGLPVIDATGYVSCFVAEMGANVIGSFNIAPNAINASECPVLANLDVAVSSRLAAADYTAPDDPLDNPVPGSYATGTAGYNLGKLGSGQITTVSPVAQSGDVEVVVGDTYTDNLGRALEWTDASAAWPDLTDATIKMEVGDGTLVKAGSVVVATGSSKRVRVELLASETDDLTAGVYDFQVVAEFPGTGVSAGETDRATLVRGKMTVIDSEAS